MSPSKSVKTVDEKIKLWLEKSEVNFEAAEMLASVKKYMPAITRLYYSVFILVYAEIKKDEHVEHVHNEAINLCFKKLEHEDAKIFSELRQERIKADYDPVLPITASDYKKLFVRASCIRTSMAESLKNTGRIVI